MLFFCNILTLIFLLCDELWPKLRSFFFGNDLCHLKSIVRMENLECSSMSLTWMALDLTAYFIWNFLRRRKDWSLLLFAPCAVNRVWCFTILKTINKR
jgi:hypothetical protein